MILRLLGATPLYSYKLQQITDLFTTIALHSGQFIPRNGLILLLNTITLKAISYVLIP